MIQIELTSKLVLAIIGITSVSAILVPTYAVPTIRSGDIFDETIQSVDIKNGEVKNEDIASGAIPPNVHIVQGNSPTIAPGSSETVLVECSAPEEVLTGGGAGAPAFVQVSASFPFDDSRWFARGLNEGTTDAVLTAYAICAGPSP